ncbi:hypothetical protein AF336_13770 [Bradyrhizobium diazoefficiens]|nr:hypothetical protein BD122_29240 [Bradyrhizobium diazoefficiens]KOY10412.1 hypothetical protein AF336_13770 [Bradyrhizobium diazoefficiens]
MAPSRTDTGRLNHQMEDDPSRPHPHATAHPPADDHVAEDRGPQPRTDHGNSAPIIHPPHEAPALSSAHFGSGQEESGRVTAIANWMQRGRRIWRGHLQRDQLPEATGGSMGNIERWLLALLSVLVIVSCVCATIVLMQATALKAEIATLQREIIALKLRVARLDQIASANEARDKPSTEAPKPPAENRPDQTALVLSREEIQLIRDYIKPAPVAGSATEQIKVGDPVTGETIPFPSPITEKVRKLLGARFTIRNGVIVITRIGSRHADVVIGPN